MGIDADGVDVEMAGAQRRRVDARTVVGAAGVEASPLAAVLGRATGAERDRTGRVTVEADLTLPGRPEVLAFGDMVRVAAAGGGTLDLPGLAPVAMQQGRYAARVVGERLAGGRVVAFATRGRGARLITHEPVHDHESAAPDGSSPALRAG